MTPARCAVIFDWNGTILADTALIVRANNETLRLFQKPPVSIQSYRDAHSVPFEDMYLSWGIERAELHARQKEIYAVFGNHYESHAPKLRQRRGAREMLAALKTRGHKTAILSNYTIERIVPQAQRLGLDGFFDEVLANSQTYECTFKNKTKGQRLQAFVARHETQKALVVGDTIEEIEIAHDYGFLAVAIENGACSASRLRAARPDFQIRNLAEITNIAAKVFGTGGAR